MPLKPWNDTLFPYEAGQIYNAVAIHDAWEFSIIPVQLQSCDVLSNWLLVVMVGICHPTSASLDLVALHSGQWPVDLAVGL